MRFQHTRFLFTWSRRRWGLCLKFELAWLDLNWISWIGLTQLLPQLDSNKLGLMDEAGVAVSKLFQTRIYCIPPSLHPAISLKVDKLSTILHILPIKSFLSDILLLWFRNCCQQHKAGGCKFGFQTFADSGGDQQGSYRGGEDLLLEGSNTACSTSVVSL